MAEPSHGPTHGLGNTLLFLGRGECPECGDALEEIAGAWTCDRCELSFPLGGKA